MTWLTWRQFRAQAAAAIGALVAFAILLAATGPHLASLYGASGIPGCHGGGCGQLASNFLIGLGPDYPFVYLLGLAGVVNALTTMVYNPFVGVIFLVASVLGACIGIVMSRIAAEFVLIVFRINEHLGAIRNQGGLRNQ